jgi:hypothetical protein
MINNNEERRIVQGDSISRIQPMIDIGFYPSVLLEYPETSIDDSFDLIQDNSLEQLIEEVIWADDVFEKFKVMENIVKNIFEPVEVKQMYLMQQKYKNYDAFNCEED